MATDRFYQHRPRTMIPVTVQPNDGQRFIRLRSSNTSADDFGNRMSLRMREFEDECRRWREQFFRDSPMDINGFPHSSMLSSRPRLFMDFPDFPEFGSVDWPSFRGPALGSGLSRNAGTHRSFVEEDNDGRKRYKVQFDIGDFRPEELNVRVEGRMLIVKGDRQVKVGHATESKQFNRELTIPEFVDTKNIQSYLTDDGQLIMEAPVLLDRVYNNQTGSTPISSSASNRLVDTTFTGGRTPASSVSFNNNNHGSTGFSRNPVSTGFNYNPVSTDFGNNQLSTGFGNNQSSAYSSTSSTSSFRQESTGLRDAGSFSRNSPLRDPYSSTASSTSTLIGGTGIGGHNNQISSGFSTNVARPEQYSFDRANGSKTASYTFDLHQFAPEDIAIQVNDTMLKVTAVKQERDARNSSQREYRREIGLPDGADPKNLTNSLGADGVLTVQIPVRDHRPPLTPTLRSQQFDLPTNVSTCGGGLAEGEQQLKLTFDLSGYKPDDVTVKVNDNVLKVQAAHAENTPGNQISREYMREYVLPDWVDANKLRAKMSEDSTLTVEVPIPHDRVSSLNRQINITH